LNAVENTKSPVYRVKFCTLHTFSFELYIGTSEFRKLKPLFL